MTPFLSMTRGFNALNECNTTRGHWTHGDGWGAVIEAEDGLAVVRSAQPCWNDPAFRELADQRVFMLHARRASKGRISEENAHPFAASCEHDTWTFCHNGTVRDSLQGSDDTEDGRTDSEMLFRRLVPFLCGGAVLSGVREVYGNLQEFTSVNSFLLCSSEFWVVSGFRTHTNYFTLHWADTPAGPIVSSEPLAELNDRWARIEHGSVLRYCRLTGELQTYRNVLSNESCSKGRADPPKTLHDESRASTGE